MSETRLGRVRVTETGRVYSVDATTGAITRLTRCSYCLRFFYDKMGLLTEAGQAHRDYILAWVERNEALREAKASKERRDKQESQRVSEQP